MARVISVFGTAASLSISKIARTGRGLHRLLNGPQCLKIYHGKRNFTSGEDEMASCTASVAKICMPELEEPPVIDPCWTAPKVVIVGAGIAGLSAAHRLIECGICDLTLLEATDRPGGRIWSCWMGDTVVELGADQIRGAHFTNPVYTLATEEGLLKPSREMFCDPSCPDEELFFTTEGRAVQSSGVEKLVVERLIGQAKELFEASPSGGGPQRGNLQHYLSIRIQQQLLDFPKYMRYDSERIMYGLINGLRAHIGEDLSKVSALQFGLEQEIPGGNVKVPLGFIGVLAPLLRGIPRESVHYQKPVYKISWGGPECPDGHRVVVKTCDGCEFPADYCVITMPLGVLQNGMDKIFCPKLPEEKREAIKSLGVGHQCKVFLEYGRPWWCCGEGTMRLAWSHEELVNRNDWSKAIPEITNVQGSDVTLSFTVGGPETEALENCTEEEIAFHFTRLLRKFTGDTTVPYPCNVLRTTWTSDKFFQGATSYMKSNSRIGHRKDFFEPTPGPKPGGKAVPPILFFAGEAASLDAYNTVHGARKTGITQAEKIVSLTKQFKGRPPAEKVEEEPPPPKEKPGAACDPPAPQI